MSQPRRLPGTGWLYLALCCSPVPRPAPSCQRPPSHPAWAPPVPPCWGCPRPSASPGVPGLPLACQHPGPEQRGRLHLAAPGAGPGLTDGGSGAGGPRGGTAGTPPPTATNGLWHRTPPACGAAGLPRVPHPLGGSHVPWGVWWGVPGSACPGVPGHGHWDGSGGVEGTVGTAGLGTLGDSCPRSAGSSQPRARVRPSVSPGREHVCHMRVRGQRPSAGRGGAAGPPGVAAGARPCAGGRGWRKGKGMAVAGTLHRHVTSRHAASRTEVWEAVSAGSWRPRVPSRGEQGPPPCSPPPGAPPAQGPPARPQALGLPQCPVGTEQTPR